MNNIRISRQVPRTLNLQEALKEASQKEANLHKIQSASLANIGIVQKLSAPTIVSVERKQIPAATDHHSKFPSVQDALAEASKQLVQQFEAARILATVNAFIEQTPALAEVIPFLTQPPALPATLPAALPAEQAPVFEVPLDHPVLTQPSPLPELAPVEDAIHFLPILNAQAALLSGRESPTRETTRPNTPQNLQANEIPFNENILSWINFPFGRVNQNEPEETSSSEEEKTAYSDTNSEGFIPDDQTCELSEDVTTEIQEESPLENVLISQNDTQEINYAEEFDYRDWTLNEPNYHSEEEVSDSEEIVIVNNSNQEETIVSNQEETIILPNALNTEVEETSDMNDWEMVEIN